MALETHLIDLVFPGETNHHGTLFGGAALAYMDKLAYIVAARHALTDFVTASCDQIDFAAPAHLGEIVEVTGRVVRTGRRSLTVETDLEAESLRTGQRRLCSRGRFHLVAADPAVRVPPLPAPQPADAAEPPPPLRMVELVFPDQCSHRHVLFGGYAQAVMGKAAFVAATRFCGRTVVMAASRGMDFIAPVHVGEIMEVTARVGAVGTSSMVVEVVATGENLQTGERRPAARGSYTMVAIDDDSGRPCPARREGAGPSV
ncbi:acyl-CoA thioesterase [Phaeospirillum tilakii]|uniref:Acyl-CoA thioesterase n=1 Tax=Phaeospirillum tilakii TaxID=741673 RepID=A0ABW5CEG3_9PROT